MTSSKIFSLSIGLVGILSLTGCGAVFVNDGSKNASLAEGLANPDSNVKKVDVPKEACVISNFEDGSKVVNPKLYGSGSGSWITLSFSGNFIASGGANGTKMAAHMTGTLVDKGDFVYPGFTLQGRFKDSGFYDASAFTGIKFYYKCMATDQGLKRRFAIGIAPTLPASEGGTCSDGCYNHFGEDMAVSPDWVAKTYAFADMKRESGWGSPVTPPDLTDHLKEFINLKWEHAANNAAGSYNIDYWVDEIEFY